MPLMDSGTSTVLAALIGTVGVIIAALISTRRKRTEAGQADGPPPVIINIMNGYRRGQAAKVTKTRLPGHVSDRETSKAPRRAR